MLVRCHLDQTFPLKSVMYVDDTKQICMETFVKNIRWRAHFFLNPQEKPAKEKYGFKSLKAAPKVKDLQKLEDGMCEMVRQIEFLFRES